MMGKLIKPRDSKARVIKNKRGNKVTPQCRRVTRSQTKEKRLEEERKRKRAEIIKAQEIRKKREEELKALAEYKVPDGNRGDGNFYIAFLKMGQGDCTLVSTPKGQFVMIDCGSDSLEGEDEVEYLNRVCSVVHDRRFLGNSNTIDTLILTHPDTDHYNKLSKILGDSISIIRTFHSSGLQNYSASSASDYIRRRCQKNNIKEATVSKESYKKVIKMVEEDGCNLYCIASNVKDLAKNSVTKEPINDYTNTTNRGSLVSLIEVFGKKIVVCGDASTATEYDILTRGNEMKQRLSNVSIAQIAHHGSIRTSSSNDWVITVRPRYAVASCGKEIPMHHLPSKEALERYIREGCEEFEEHSYYYYESGALGSYNHNCSRTKQALFTTGSTGSIVFRITAHNEIQVGLLS